MIPVTVFEDKVKSIFNPREEVLIEGKRYNKVNMTRFNKDQQVPYASYHSKLILYEFDDRLRVIISSANLTKISWTDLS
jgi:phosphatidylserine/phosphatidylglycerophosphate/cardiolipin synthase-like enzyme